MRQIYYPGLIRYLHLPEIPTLMFEILSCPFIYRLFTGYFRSGKSRKSYKFFNTYIYFFFGLITLVGVSSVLNQDSWFLVIKSMLSYYFPFIIVFILVADAEFSEKEQMNLLKFLFVLIVLQIPFTVFQYIHFHYPTADSNNGTISSELYGGTGILAVLEAFMMSFAVAQFLFKGFRLNYFLLAVFTFIPPVVGGARFGFIAIPFSIFMTILSFSFLYRKVPLKKYINMIAVFIVFGAVFLFIVVAIIPQTKYASF